MGGGGGEGYLSIRQSWHTNGVSKAIFTIISCKLSQFESSFHHFDDNNVGNFTKLKTQHIKKTSGY